MAGLLWATFGTDVDIGGDIAFTNNVAYKGGGAVCAVDETEVKISGKATFASNMAYSNGGAIRVQNSSALSIDEEPFFEGNSANTGGAISESACILNVDGSPSFTHNFATVNGGAINSAEAKLITLKGGLEFADNEAGGRGGAVSIREPGEFDITGGTFERNVAHDGGAVYLSVFQDTQRALTSCVFEDNTASDGGALFIDTGGGVDMISSSHFSGNYAATSGGAVYHVGALQVSHTIFSANKAGEEGLAITNLGSTDVVLESVAFIDNTKHCPAGQFGYEEDDTSNNTRFDLTCTRCLGEGKAIGASVEVRVSNTIPECKELPEGVAATSSGVTVSAFHLEEGYYRTSNSTSHVVECHHYGACTGGIDAGKYCSTGYEGPYCAVCSESHAPAGTYICRKCSDKDMILTMGLVVAMSVLVVLLVAACFVHFVKVVDNGSGAGTIQEERSFVGRSCGYLRGMFTRVFPLTAVKIVLVVWQIISQFAAVAGDVYPEAYAAFISNISCITLDIGFVRSYSCILAINFYDRLLLATIFPLLVFATLTGTYYIARFRNRSTESSIREVRHKHLSAALFFAFFIYSSVSFTIFQTFVCDRSLDDVPFLRADYSLPCDTDVYSKYKAYAIAMVCVYPIGVPAVFAWWLLRNRVELARPTRDTVSHLAPLSGIWAAYRPSRYYYEVVECGRRIALTAAAIFVLPNSMSQRAVVLLLAAVFLLVSESLSPFCKNIDMRLYRWGNGIVLASMYVALLMKVNIANEGQISISAFGNVLILANVFMVITVVAQSVNMLHGVAPSAWTLQLPSLRRTP